MVGRNVSPVLVSADAERARLLRSPGRRRRRRLCALSCPVGRCCPVEDGIVVVVVILLVGGRLLLLLLFLLAGRRRCLVDRRRSGGSIEVRVARQANLRQALVDRRRRGRSCHELVGERRRGRWACCRRLDRLLLCSLRANETRAETSDRPNINPPSGPSEFQVVNFRRLKANRRRHAQACRECVSDGDQLQQRS